MKDYMVNGKNSALCNYGDTEMGGVTPASRSRELVEESMVAEAMQKSLAGEGPVRSDVAVAGGTLICVYFFGDGDLLRSVVFIFQPSESDAMIT